ncbi:hypothetical protein KPH14_009960 [Odynerus spinipes]|uniref:Cytochrome P450 n=1 Tax=Odynerus spinipes TaxID=1348599 RepID=A0AAD9RSQ8_9HYME|nr:hypothetical protein KPH14_009960 [Odynerus spinipes]
MEAWATILALVVAVLAIYHYVFKNWNYFKKSNIPYNSPWPVLGNMGVVLLRQKTMAEMTIDAYNINPKAKYVGFFDMATPVVIVRDPELIKSIANERWRETRTMLSPAFTSSKLKGMYKLMNNCATNFADYIANMPKEKRTLEMKDAFTRYTNDVIATCAFGIGINSMKDQNNDFYVLGKEATNFTGIKSLLFFVIRSWPTLSKVLNIKIISDKVVSFFKNIVKETIETRDREKIVRGDMIQLMMEARDKRAEHGKELELIDMVAQAFIFFFGGFDSVSTAMCFTCHEIGVHQDVQERLQQEIDEVLEKTNGNPSYEVINNMEYLDAVINESLRMYPIVVFLDRVCNQNFELPPTLPGREPFLVKKGTNVWFPVYAFHHDPKYFEEPGKFNPDRFIERGKEIQNSGVYLPFGLGPRMCIGNRFALLEIKVLIFHLLARCNLKPCAKTSIPMKMSKKTISVTAENGFWMDIEPRSDTHSSLRNSLSNGTVIDDAVCNANGVTNGHAVKA